MVSRELRRGQGAGAIGRAAGAIERLSGRECADGRFLHAEWSCGCDHFAGARFEFYVDGMGEGFALVEGELAAGGSYGAEECAVVEADG